MDDFGTSMNVHPTCGPDDHYDQWVVSTAAYGGAGSDDWTASVVDV